MKTKKKRVVKKTLLAKKVDGYAYSPIMVDIAEDHTVVSMERDSVGEWVAKSKHLDHIGMIEWLLKETLMNQNTAEHSGTMSEVAIFLELSEEETLEMYCRHYYEIDKEEGRKNLHMNPDKDAE